MPDPGATAATVAVKVTLCPLAEGFCDEVTLVVVLALFTVWPPARVPLLVLKFPSPLYCATTVCGLPLTVNAAVLSWAEPPLRVIGPPALEPSITNWTVPVGVPTPGVFDVTVAVNVVLCPNTVGLIEEVTAVVVLALATITDSFGSLHIPVTPLLLASPL